MNKKECMKSQNSCQICSKNARGYYYGAYVCEACKKFFVRHTSGTCRHYGSCQYNGTCNLAMIGRGKCQHCRFKRCKDIGMSISYRKNDSNLTAMPCRICGAKSSGLHFGCVTCEGCKNFFKRMINFNGKLTCINNNNCELNPNTRNTCKSCRLNRCINSGMSRKSIRIGRHTNALKYNAPQLEDLINDNDSSIVNNDRRLDYTKLNIDSLINDDLILSHLETIRDPDFVRHTVDSKVRHHFIDNERCPNGDVDVSMSEVLVDVASTAAPSLISEKTNNKMDDQNVKGECYTKVALQLVADEQRLCHIRRSVDATLNDLRKKHNDEVSTLKEELSKTQEDNKRLRNQNESLLRVFSKIQQELGFFCETHFQNI